MPIRYRILKEHRLVHAVSAGKVTVDDLVRHMDELAADPDYVRPMKKLVDYRRGPAVALDNEGVLTVSIAKSRHRSTFAGERCAFVTPRDVDFGMSRAHAARMDETGVEIAVFRDLVEALQWLEVDLPAAMLDDEGG